MWLTPLNLMFRPAPARDVARKLIELQQEREGPASLPSIEGQHEFTIVVAA